MKSEFGRKMEIHLEAINVAQAALNTPVIDLSDDDFGAVLNCAIRYCLGRRTYMPELVVSYIRPLLPHLNDKALSVMEKDVSSCGPFGYGDQCDCDTWVRFLADIKAARAARET